jgi:hypothetical protein
VKERASVVSQWLSVSSGLLLVGLLLEVTLDTGGNQGGLLGDSVSASVCTGETSEILAALTNAGTESRHILGSAGLDRCHRTGCIQILNLPAEVAPQETFTLRMRFAAKSPGTFSEVIPLVTDHKSDAPRIFIEIDVLPKPDDADRFPGE